MSKYRVRQLRSGEGAILTNFSHLGAASLPAAVPELFEEHALLVAGEHLPPEGPPGADRLGEGVWLLRGPAALDFLATAEARGKSALIWALVDEAPSSATLGRCLPDPLRPWDHERLGARVYSQSGGRFAHEGLWFREPEERRLWLELAVRRILEAGGNRLPTGDVALVLDMPTDATFEAVLVARGRGEGFRLRRDFGNQGFLREWWIERGEWKGEHRVRRSSRKAPLRQRLVQVAATTGIFLLALPVSAFVFLVLLTTRLTDASTTARGLTEKG